MSLRPEFKYFRNLTYFNYNFAPWCQCSSQPYSQKHRRVNILKWVYKFVFSTGTWRIEVDYQDWEQGMAIAKDCALLPARNTNGGPRVMATYYTDRKRVSATEKVFQGIWSVLFLAFSGEWRTSETQGLMFRSGFGFTRCVQKSSDLHCLSCTHLCSLSRDCPCPHLPSRLGHTCSCSSHTLRVNCCIIKSGQGIYVTSRQSSGVWYPLCECALATRMYPILRGDNDLLQLIAVGKK